MPVQSSALGKGNKKKEETPQIDRTSVVMDIVSLCPAAADIMAEYGLHCFSCEVGGHESLEDGCAMHGLDDETIDALVDDVNDVLRAQPGREKIITITTPAANALLAIAKQENREEQGLSIVPDGSGGFCMEFQEEPLEGDLVFCNPEVPTVRCFASERTLWRIGGAVIDIRDERFKLDLPEDADECCGGSKSGCGCS